MDRIEVAEYVPVGYRVTFNCNVFRTVRGVAASGPNSDKGPAKTSPQEAGELGSLKNPSIGIFPRSSGTPSEILTNGHMRVTIADRLTGVVLYRLEEVKAQTLNFSITARGIVGQNVSFNAIRMKSEDEPG